MTRRSIGDYRRNIIRFVEFRSTHHPYSHLLAVLASVTRVRWTQISPSRSVQHTDTHGDHTAIHSRIAGRRELTSTHLSRIVIYIAQGVDNVYAQHVPLIKELLDQLLRGKLKDTSYPNVLSKDQPHAQNLSQQQQQQQGSIIK